MTDSRARVFVLHRIPAPVRLVTALAAVGMVVAVFGFPGAAARASFAGTTRAWGSFSAATARPADSVSCRNNADGTATVSWKYTGDRPLDFDVLVDGQGSMSRVGADTHDFVVRPNSPFSFGRTSVFRIQTNLTRGWTVTSSASVSVTTSTFFWIGVARCA